MIVVDQLYHSYPGTGHFQVEDVSFEVREGEIFGFLGPTGAGKSTTQKIMMGLLSLQRGGVSLAGEDIRKAGRRLFNQIGVVFEQPNLYRKLTGLENLRFYAGLYDVETDAPMTLLQRMGLDAVANHWVSTYSKGMRQRLMLARSLINRPHIWFLDEPTGGLDPQASQDIRQLIREKQDEGVTIFLTTHQMHVAEELCDRVAFIESGRLIAMDSPRELKLRHGDQILIVEHRDNGELITERLDRDAEADQRRLYQLLQMGQVETLHSQEATLEEIFISLTGKELV
jgi:fluoroquinolone transport system ATP-binding protein